MNGDQGSGKVSCGGERGALALKPASPAPPTAAAVTAENASPNVAAGASVAPAAAATVAATATATDTAGEGVWEAPRLRESELSRAVDESGVVCQTHVGGQALIEGVMMRGRYNWAVAVREPSENLYTEEHDLASGRDKNSWMYKPVVRGCTALVESLALGYKALDIAAQHAFAEEPEECDDGGGSAKSESGHGDGSESGSESGSGDGSESGSGDGSENRTDEPSPCPLSEPSPLPLEKDDKTEAPLLSHAPAPGTAERVESSASASPEDSAAIPKPLMTLSMVIGVLLGIGIFIVLPAIVTNLLVGDYGERTLLWNLVDGVLRVAIFIFYIWLIGRMPDIRRMFAYHGAEHKVIHCYEHGLPLTVRNARRFPTLHVRCGTAFMIMTMIVAILVFTLVPVNVLIDALGVHNGIARLVLVIISRVILLPLVAGLSYEVTVKWAGSRPENPLVRVVLWPGLQLQRLTTNEPDDSMLQTAIAAMQMVLAREQLEQARELDSGAAA